MVPFLVHPVGLMRSVSGFKVIHLLEAADILASLTDQTSRCDENSVVWCGARNQTKQEARLSLG